MRIRIVNEEDVDAGLDAEIRRGLVLCFPNDASTFASTRSWHGSSPSFSALLEERDSVLAHVGIVDRIVRLDVPLPSENSCGTCGPCGTRVPPVDSPSDPCGTGISPVDSPSDLCGTGVSPVRSDTAVNSLHSIRVAGIQNVYVLPDHRGRGYVNRVLEAAMTEARRRGFDHGLLFCVPELEKIYARCGWRTLSSVAVTRIDETGHEVGLPGRNFGMYYPLANHSFPIGRIHLQGNDW